MPPDDRAIRYFRAVYATGSLRAAARQLGVAPSAVSRRIAALERDLGSPLLERTPRGIRPTDAGHALARFAADRRHREAVLREELDRLSGVETGHVRVVTGEGFVDDLVRHGVGPFLQDRPRVRVDIEVCGTSQMGELLLAGEVDLMLAYHALPHPEIRVVAQAEQPLHVVCAPGHALAGLTAVEPRRLDGEPAAVLAPGFGTRTITDQLQASHGFCLDVRMETTSVLAAQCFCAGGNGIALLPAFVVTGPVAAGGLRAVPLLGQQGPGVRTQLARRRDREGSHAAEALATHLGAHLTSLQPPPEGPQPVEGVAAAATRCPPKRGLPGRRRSP